MVEQKFIEDNFMIRSDFNMRRGNIDGLFLSEN